MPKAMEEEKLAVQSGYWYLFRFDPRKAANGENPFTLDSKAPPKDYQEFIMGESRYINLKKQNPESRKTLLVRLKPMQRLNMKHLLREQKNNSLTKRICCSFVVYILFIIKK